MKECLWSDAYFTGIASVEEQEKKYVKKAIHTIMADPPGCGSGVRIHFSSASRYRSLVSVLDILEKEKVRKFWLDIHNAPITLYAFEEPPAPSVITIGGCFLYNDVIHSAPPPPPPVPFWVRFDETVTELWLRPLQQPDWRTSIWLLVAIAALSGWRIVRSWRTA